MMVVRFYGSLIHPYTPQICLFVCLFVANVYYMLLRKRVGGMSKLLF